MTVDRQLLLAIAVGCLLAAILAVLSVELDWSVGAVYGAFVAIAAVVGLILSRKSPPRTPGGRRG